MCGVTHTIFGIDANQRRSTPAQLPRRKPRPRRKLDSERHDAREQTSTHIRALPSTVHSCERLALAYGVHRRCDGGLGGTRQKGHLRTCPWRRQWAMDNERVDTRTRCSRALRFGSPSSASKCSRTARSVFRPYGSFSGRVRGICTAFSSDQYCLSFTAKALFTFVQCAWQPTWFQK